MAPGANKGQTEPRGIAPSACDDERMLDVRASPRHQSASAARAQAGRRVKAARMLAGDVSVRDAARLAGLDYRHLAAIEHGRKPLTSSDCVDLGRVLDVPSEWLAHGWGR